MKTFDDLLANAAKDMQHVKNYFPFRFVWCAIHPETLDVQGPFAKHTKHGIQKHLKAGYNVYEATR